MPRAYIPAQLRGLTAGQAEVEAPAATVRELIEELDSRFPGIRERLCTEGELSPALQVSIDGAFTRRGLAAPLRPDSEVHFLPVFGGG